MLDRRRGLRRKDAPSWVDGYVWHACGRRMYAARHDAGDTLRRWRYRCGHTTPSKVIAGDRCDVRPGSMMVNKIEAAFARQLEAALIGIATPAEVAARLDAERAGDRAERDEDRRRVERRIADVAAQRDRLLDMALRGTVAEDAYQRRDAALRTELATLRDQREAIPGPVDADALAMRYRTLLTAREALAITLRHAPDELPGILAALDARLVIGLPGGPALRFGSDVAAFVRGENGS
jgi:hypothetical protein